MEDLLRREFNVARACRELGRFNRTLRLAAADFVVARQFPPYAPLRPGEARQALDLLDFLWNTRLAFDRGALKALSAAYERNRQAYVNRFAALRRLRPEESPPEVYAIGKEALATLLSTGGRVKKHYSFATKVFHWHAREHLPIVDSRARRAINALQRSCGLRRDIVLSSTGEMGRRTYVEEYGRWLAFYSQIMGALTRADRERLLAADRESLPPAFTLENSLLRVLDKVFWYRGGRPPQPASGGRGPHGARGRERSFWAQMPSMRASSLSPQSNAADAGRDAAFAEVVQGTGPS